MKPLAIMPVFNEEDILPWTIAHLQGQGCEVYVLDNWSTDLSASIAGAFQCGYERWPAERPQKYEWTEILVRIEEIAREKCGDGRWCMLHDADEIRRSPNGSNAAGECTSAISLAESFDAVNASGYNAVQFRAFTFYPIDNDYSGNPEQYFRHFAVDHIDTRQQHVKAWFQQPLLFVDLHSTGGHDANFARRRVHPTPFILKHYPIRSQQHGERKVLRERLPRYPDSERAKRWHVQYDEFREGPQFIRNPEELFTWPR